MLKHIKLRGFCLFFMATFYYVNCGAEIPEPENVVSLVREAGFVFEGRVVNVEYRFSERDNKNTPPTPYTFVSYEILKVIKGYYDNPVVTLRFFGGPVNEDEYITTSNQLLFDVGDHDLLLVTGNNYLLCPLVNCAQGRFRYINGLVVNELGQTIRIDEDGKIHYGTAIKSDEIETHRMSDTIQLFRESIEGEAEFHEEPIAVEEVDHTILPDTSGFTASVEQTIIESHSPTELATTPPFETADPEKKFRDRLMEEIYSRPVDAPEHALAGTPINDSENIELLLEQRLEDAKNSPKDVRQKLILEMAEQYPEYYYDGVRGDELLKQHLSTKKSTTISNTSGFSVTTSMDSLVDAKKESSVKHIIFLSLLLLILAYGAYQFWRGFNTRC